MYIQRKYSFFMSESDRGFMEIGLLSFWLSDPQLPPVLDLLLGPASHREDNSMSGPPLLNRSETDDGVGKDSACPDWETCQGSRSNADKWLWKGIFYLSAGEREILQKSLPAVQHQSTMCSTVKESLVQTTRTQGRYTAPQEQNITTSQLLWGYFGVICALFIDCYDWTRFTL